MPSAEVDRRPLPVFLIPGLVGLLPVIHSMSVSRWFMVPQQALLLVVLGVLIAVGVAGSARWLRDETIAVKGALLSLTFTVVWLGISSMIGPDPSRSLITDDWQGTSWLFWVVCLMLFAATLRVRDQIGESTARAISWGVGALATLSLLSFIGGDAIQETLVPLSPEGVPLAGIGNTAFLGAFCGVACLVILGRWLRSTRSRNGLLVLSASSAALMVLTQSRVSLLATSTLLVVGLWRSRGTVDRQRSFVAFGIIALAAIVAQVFFVPNLVAPGQTNTTARAETDLTPAKFESSAIQGGLELRRGLWGAALDTIKSEPWFGAGANNFSFAYGKFASTADHRSVALQFDTAVNDAHNLILEVGATGGIPAALGLLVTVLMVGWGALPRRGGPSGVGVKAWAGLGALVLLAESLFQPLNLVSLPLLLILSAISLPDPPQPVPVLRRAPSVAVAAGALPIVVSVVLAAMLIYSDNQLRVGSLEWRASNLKAAVDANPYCTRCLFELGKVRRWDHVKEGRGTARAAIAPNLTAIARHPSDAETYTQLGGGYLFMDQPAKALPQFEKALALNRHSWLAGQGMAVALLRLERFSEAVPYLQKSAVVNPSPRAFLLLAETAEKAGMAEVAMRALQSARRLEDADGN